MSLQFVIDWDTEAQITKAILTELADYLNSRNDDISAEIKSVLVDEIDYAIRNSEEYRQMLPGGILYGQIGLPEIEDTLNGVITAIQEKTGVFPVKFIVLGDKVTGGWDFGILTENYEEVLSVANTTFISTNLEGISTPVPWMEWLLLAGTSRVVADHIFYKNKVTAKFSRTKTSIMRYGNKGWGFPAEYAGVKQDNWLTRAIFATHAQIEGLIEAEIEGSF